MKNIIALAQKLHDSVFTKVDYLQSPLLLAIRLYWGWQLMQTGWGKLHNIPKVVEFFTSLNIPMPGFNAYMVANLEFFGGMLLFVGLASRLIAIPLFINMTVAYLTADKEALHSIFSEPDKFYNAAPYTFWFAALLILVFGPGKISLDTLIRKFIFKPETDNAAVAPKP